MDQMAKGPASCELMTPTAKTVPWACSARSTSRKIWSEVGNELDNATGLAAICVQVWIVDDEAQPPTTAGAKRGPHDLLEMLPRQASSERDFPRCATCGEIAFVEHIQIRVEPPVRCMRGNAPDGLTRRPSRIRSDLFGAPHDHAASNTVDPELMPPGVIMRTQHHESIRFQGAKGPANGCDNPSPVVPNNTAISMLAASPTGDRSIGVASS